MNAVDTCLRRYDIRKKYPIEFKALGSSLRWSDSVGIGWRSMIVRVIRELFYSFSRMSMGTSNYDLRSAKNDL